MPASRRDVVKFSSVHRARWWAIIAYKTTPWNITKMFICFVVFCLQCLEIFNGYYDIDHLIDY